jgi:zinc transport system substrate-binding protein
MTTLILGLLLPSCTRTERSATARLTVAATFLPIWTIARNVAQGIPGVDVKLLLPPGMGSPHDVSLTVAQGALLEKADVLVMNGLGLERFLDNNPALKRPDLVIIRATESVDTVGLPVAPELLEIPGGEHEGFAVNPHAWVSPRQEIIMTRYVADQFARIDTAFTDQYHINADRYVARLDSLDYRFRELVAQAPNRRIVTFHRAFDYLARDYGLEIVGVIENEPGMEPSARALTDLVRKIQQTKPAAIFTEPYYPDKVARTLSDETGVPVYQLDPVETGPADANAYISAMWRNMQVLGTALLLRKE